MQRLPGELDRQQLPLDLLILSSPATIEVTTPAIIEGHVENLAFYHCHNLQRYSLEKWESLEDLLPFVGISETEEKWTLSMENWTSRQLQNRMLKHYVQAPPELKGNLPPTKSKTLVITGNNAISMFIGFCLPFFPAAAWFEGLTLLSADYNDLGGWANDDAPEELFFATFLLVLEKLKVLKLSIGERLLSSQDGLETPLLRMSWRFLSPKLEGLHFRGPVELAPFIDGWVEAFGDEKFLPSLKRMGVLDRTKEGEVVDEKVRDDARLAFQRLKEAVAARGVVMEDFEDLWEFR